MRESHSPLIRYQLVEKQLVEFSAIAMQRGDFKKTDDMFNRVLGKDHIAVVCLLENKETGTRLVLANAHIHWDATFRDVKLVQAGLLLDEVEKMANNFARLPPRLPPGATVAPGTRPSAVYKDGSKIPVVVCGDYNSILGSGVCDLFSTGQVPPTHPDFMSHLYGRYTSEGIRHNLGLKSAYSGNELPLTNLTPTFREEIDYIWYSTQNLAVNAVLGEIDRGYIEKVVGFPNAHFPSEYVFGPFLGVETYSDAPRLFAAISPLPPSFASSHRAKPSRRARSPISANRHDHNCHEAMMASALFFGCKYFPSQRRSSKVCIGFYSFNTLVVGFVGTLLRLSMSFLSYLHIVASRCMVVCETRNYFAISF